MTGRFAVIPTVASSTSTWLAILTAGARIDLDLLLPDCHTEAQRHQRPHVLGGAHGDGAATENDDAYSVDDDPAEPLPPKK